MMDYTNDGGITAIEIKALGILLLLIAIFCFVLFSVYRVSLKKSREDCKLKLKISLQSSDRVLY